MGSAVPLAAISGRCTLGGVTISRALLERLQTGGLRPDVAAAERELRRRGFDTRLFAPDELRGGALLLSYDTLVVASIPVTIAALERLGVPLPAPLDYPEPLRAYLGRRVWASTLREVTMGFRDGSLGAVFLKPRSRHKLFTGRVVSDRGALAPMAGWGGGTLLWCSDPVEFVAEWRVFLCDGQPRGVRRYSERDAPYDPARVDEIIAAWRAHGTMPAACAIDVGVLRDGRTVLVEANDAFSLGGYGLDTSDLVDLYVARWQELVARNEGGRCSG